MQPGDLIVSDARPLQPGDLFHAWQVLDQVMDPEVPVLSVVALGIIRELAWHAGQLQVVVTPTYSGCPATEVIERDIRDALQQAGFDAPLIDRQLSPAWTTDWITIRGREQLRAYGIAPPPGSTNKRTLLGEAPEVLCPQCESARTEVVSFFGSTACKALYRCCDCREPFDYFKCI